MTINVTPLVVSDVLRDTNFSITFSATYMPLQATGIESVRAYPSGMGGTNSSVYDSWDTGVTFTSGSNSVTISGQHNSAFGGDEIIHIPKGASTRMTTIYAPFTILEDSQNIEINERTKIGGLLYKAQAAGDGDDETKITYSLSSGSDQGVAVESGTGRVTITTVPRPDIKSHYSFTVIATEIRPNGERPMTSAEFARAKDEFPDLAKPEVTAGVANVPPNQEIVSFKADSSNFVDRNITIEVKYLDSDGDVSYYTTNRTLRVRNNLNKFLTWIENYLETYSPLEE